MRTSWMHLLWSLMALLGFLVGATCAHPDWLAELGLEGEGEGEGQAGGWGLHHQESARATRLGRRMEVLHWRLKAKRQVVNQMMAGELTLFEAAAWFRFLNENPLDSPSMERSAFAGDARDEDEVLCRQVINWVWAEVRDQASVNKANEEARRLEELLAVHRTQNGTVTLPEL
jgi:hypothetical protein